MLAFLRIPLFTILKMKITINTDINTEETALLLSCKELTPEIEQVLTALRITEKQITARKNEETLLLEMKDIHYIEAVKKTIIIHTNAGVFETDLKLYEIEALVSQYNFFRVSKNTICALKKIKSLESEADGKLKITMKNGYKIVVSGLYADGLKKKLGLCR